KKVVFPASLKSVFGETLNNRCGITELVFNGNGSAITVYGTYTDFLAKTSLETLFLNRTFSDPEGTDVTSAVIGSKNTLRNITFGENMTTTPELTGCAMIRNITVLNPVPPTAGEFAPEVYANATVTVPSGSAAAYRAADVWKNFAHITDGAPVCAIDPAKIRYTIGTGDNLYAVALSFGNDQRLDNLVWGYRTDETAVAPEAVVNAIAQADTRLNITTDANGTVTAAEFDLDGNNEFDIRDAFGEGEWTMTDNCMASDGQTRVIAMSLGGDASDAPYYFYLPAPDEQGVWVPEAMTVRLSDQGFVLPVLVQPQGEQVKLTTNWQASSSNETYRLDRTK
ncbi:MAG: hypothetical protein K2G30_10255, partial [Muribaculaceae bacterium]|nr:hypothetical protein [Muribaculaceae bacterium]